MVGTVWAVGAEGDGPERTGGTENGAGAGAGWDWVADCGEETEDAAGCGT